ncbi:YeiH family protein [Halomicroarcula sp. GCM10025324]|uniref:YeiH family protein n=1 Tax=Haloarcula TaxID=2237 RepID=UPI0023E7EE66|nr:putative sulfate exporter family transporter [Halomicroarcula sp. ZS-22-S1]
MMSLAARARTLAPGVLVLFGIALFSRGFATVVPAMSPLIVAIGCGALVANTTGVPDWVRPGLDNHKLLLETGIVLLGVRLTIAQVIETGPMVAALAAFMVVFGVLYMETVVGRLFDVGKRTTSLLAAGASVCGVSAVLAVAGSIDVDETDITYAVATILLFDAITLVVFPLVGDLLQISGKQFGIWAGLSLFSTGPTAAVGFAVSETAGQWATITKLARNTFIGIIVVGYAVRYATTETNQLNVAQIWGRFPKFLFGFLVVVLIVNLSGPSTTAVASIGTIRDWLFLLAFVGLGFDIDVDELRATGIRPVLLVLVHLVTVSVLTLSLVLSLF